MKRSQRNSIAGINFGIKAGVEVESVLGRGCARREIVDESFSISNMKT